uniref:Uncharacterized protein n=1 Tax=Vischeria stellata TaxID=1104407 RepID=A0A481XFN3_9STRA|nr:hypothetical protein [Vischeria stellata]QBK36854.1 hypothetical protein [Vischeria stellata]
MEKQKIKVDYINKKYNNDLKKLYGFTLKKSYFLCLKKSKEKTHFLKLYVKNKKFRSLLYPVKKKFYLLKLKFFVKHLSLNLDISKTNLFDFTKVLDYELKSQKPLIIMENYKRFFSVLKSSNFLFLKTDLYFFVKHLKFLRSNVYVDKLDTEYISYVLKLRTSKMYSSKIETFREKILSLIKKKLFVSLYNLSCKKKNYGFKLKKKTIIFNELRLKKSFQDYININSRYLNVRLKGLQQHLYYKKFNKYKKKLFFFSSVILNRVVIEKRINKENYIKKLFFRLKKKVFFLEFCPVLFSNFKLYRKKFIEQKKEYRYVLYHVLDKSYKKIRNKERKKFKKSKKIRILSRLYHARRRFYFRFYVPRNIEINYKTHNFIHLNYLDNLSLSSKIRLWLNLRRILSFVSF